ncbi:MAG: hypothetical protein ABW201_18440 [Candidatus Thiodiazotropha sp.]
MSSLKNDLLESYKKGKMLRTLSEKQSEGRETKDSLPSELTKLHNEGSIDVVAVGLCGLF